MALPLTAGFTIEGLCSGEAPEQRLQVVADVQRALPQQLPKIAHGIQRLDEIIDAVALGIDMFGAPSGTGSRDNLGGGGKRQQQRIGLLVLVSFLCFCGSHFCCSLGHADSHFCYAKAEEGRAFVVDMSDAAAAAASENKGDVTTLPMFIDLWSETFQVQAVFCARESVSE